MFLNSLMAFAIEQIEPIAKWLTVALIAAALLIGAFVYFKKKDSFSAFLKYAAISFAGYFFLLAIGGLQVPWCKGGENSHHYSCDLSFHCEYLLMFLFPGFFVRLFCSCFSVCLSSAGLFSACLFWFIRDCYVQACAGLFCLFLICQSAFVVLVILACFVTIR